MTESARNTLLKSILGTFIRQVWDLGDADAALDYLAEVYTIHHDPGDPWDGQTLNLDGYKNRVRQSRQPFPDQHFDIQHMCAGSGAVAMAWLWHATHYGDIQGFPATGQTIRMSGYTTYFFTPENKLCGHWQITDRLGVWRQLHNNAAGLPT